MTTRTMSDQLRRFLNGLTPLRLLLLSLAITSTFGSPALARRVSGADRCQLKNIRAASDHLHCVLDKEAKALRTGRPPKLGPCEKRLSRRIKHTAEQFGGACPTIFSAEELSRQNMLLATQTLRTIDGAPNESLPFPDLNVRNNTLLLLTTSADQMVVVKDADTGLYTVTLTGLAKQVIAFSDQPERKIGAVSTYDVLATWRRLHNHLTNGVDENGLNPLPAEVTMSPERYHANVAFGYDAGDGERALAVLQIRTIEERADLDQVVFTGSLLEDSLSEQFGHTQQLLPGTYTNVTVLMDGVLSAVFWCTGIAVTIVTDVLACVAAAAGTITGPADLGPLAGCIASIGATAFTAKRCEDSICDVVRGCSPCEDCGPRRRIRCPNSCLNGRRNNADCSCTCRRGYASVNGGCFKAASLDPNFKCRQVPVKRHRCDLLSLTSPVAGLLCMRKTSQTCTDTSECPPGSVCAEPSHRCGEQCRS